MTSVPTTAASQELLTAVNGSRAGGANTTAQAQDRFLTLLVTQMKNQDPLNPMDNAQVTSQLAQLSTVNGIDKLNQTLETLMGSFQATQSLQAASLIGREVLVPGSKLRLADGQGAFGVELAQPVDQLSVTLKDSAGRVLHRMDLGGREAGVTALAWDGVTDSGTRAADGAYVFEVQATRGGQKVEATALAAAAVGSVSKDGKSLYLNLKDLGAVTLDAVREIL